MLSRTAAHLYWIGRYMERAEFACRLVEATIRLSALGNVDESDQAWRSALKVVGADLAAGENGEPLTAFNARRYLTLSEENGSSIRTCIAAARDNARAARTALTSLASSTWSTSPPAGLESHAHGLTLSCSSRSCMASSKSSVTSLLPDCPSIVRAITT